MSIALALTTVDGALVLADTRLTLRYRDGRTLVNDTGVLELRSAAGPVVRVNSSFRKLRSYSWGAGAGAGSYLLIQHALRRLKASTPEDAAAIVAVLQDSQASAERDFGGWPTLEDATSVSRTALALVFRTQDTFQPIEYSFIQGWSKPESDGLVLLTPPGIPGQTILGLRRQLASNLDGGNTRAAALHNLAQAAALCIGVRAHTELIGELVEAFALLSGDHGEFESFYVRAPASELVLAPRFTRRARLSPRSPSCHEEMLP